MPWSSSRRAWSIVTACRKALGLSPAHRVKSFCRPVGVSPTSLGQHLQRGLVAIVEADLLDDPADGLVVAVDRGDVAL